MQDKINNPKYPKEDWKKMQYNHESLEGDNTEIHYWENIQTGDRNDLSLKITIKKK